MGGDVHVGLLRLGLIKAGQNARRPHFLGCGLLENVADLVVQRCRRTRRDPSSSNERRRKVTQQMVRFSVMTWPYSRLAGDVKRGRSMAVGSASPSRVVLAHARLAHAGTHSRSFSSWQWGRRLLLQRVCVVGALLSQGRRGESVARDGAVQVVLV